MMVKKMQDSEAISLEALVPRGLIDCAKVVLDAEITTEGLCPLIIGLENGHISKIQTLENSSNSTLRLLLPRFVETHAHIDKAFTGIDFPNLDGTYNGALKANLEEHKFRTKQKVRDRAQKALRMALFNGLRAIRTHIDSFGVCGKESWDALLEIKNEWESLIELQLVALAPLHFWSSDQGILFARRVADEGGLLGGVLTPPFDKRETKDSLSQVLSLANRFGCGVDIHIDEANHSPAAGLRLLIDVLTNNDINVPITCSHLSSMGLLPPKVQQHFAEQLAHYQVNVVALPLTNSWLLGRSHRGTPIKRPLAPVRQLQYAGVNVSIGNDNVQDPWYPLGNFDPLSLISFSMPILQIAPWSRLGLAPFTTAAARLMGLKWDGLIRVGGPADFVLLDASSWAEAMCSLPSRKIIVNGNWLEEKLMFENISTNSKT